MKKITFFLLGMLFGMAYLQAQDTDLIPIDEEHFGDNSGFLYYLTEVTDFNKDGRLSRDECATLTKISQNESMYFDSRHLKGLHYFPNLQYISISKCDSIDLSGCKALTYLCIGEAHTHICDFNDCHILSLDNCTQLDSLFIIANLPAEDWQFPSSLTQVTIASDSLKHFNFNLPQLKHLDISAPIIELNAKAYPLLQTLTLLSYKSAKRHSFQMEILDVSELAFLESILIAPLGWNDTVHHMKHIDCHDCKNLTSFSLGWSLDDDSFTPSCFTTLESLNLSGCEKLTSFHIFNCPKLASLDLRDCANLITLYINAPLTALQLSDQDCLTHLSLFNTQLQFLALQNRLSLRGFTIRYDNTIQSIDLSGCINLDNDNTSIIITDCHSLVKLDVTGCSNIKTLFCFNNALKSLSINNSHISALICPNNQLEYLDLNGSYDLLQLNCSNNRIAALDLESFWKLFSIQASNNQLAFLNSSSAPELTAASNYHPVRLNAQRAFNLNLLPGFDVSKMRRIEGGVLNGKMLTFLQDTVRYEYRCADNGASGFFALVNDPASTPGDLPISAEYFPDERFRNYIRTHFDSDQNDSLSDEECIAVTEMDVAGLQIKTLQGLHHFVYLKHLNADNNQLTSLDLSRNAALEVLSCNANYLNVETDAAFSFDLTSLPYFDPQRIKFCRGGTLDGTRLTFQRDTVRFEYLTFYAGSALVPQSVAFHLVTELPEIAEHGGLPISEENFPDEAFRLYVTDLFDRNANDSLSERELALVEEINVAHMAIRSLKGIEHFPFLERLDCSHNQLTALNLNGNHMLKTLYCYENSLFVEPDSLRRFDLRTLPDFDPNRAENWKGGVVTSDTLTFIADEVSYAYRHRQAGGADLPGTVSFTLTAPKSPSTPNERTEAAGSLFNVHPVPFRHTLHIETALELKCVSLYNLQGRLCRRFESGFDALPADGLEPGLYLLLLETADGATHRLKAVKE